MNAPQPITRAFLDALVSGDYDRLARALAPDATMRALVPRGHLDWAGRDQVSERFTFWFGGTDDIELLGSSADEVAGRTLLTWRYRLRQERLGEAWHVIAQQAFLDVGPDGLVERVDLLCSGFRAELPSPADQLATSGARS